MLAIDEGGPVIGFAGLKDLRRADLSSVIGSSDTMPSSVSRPVSSGRSPVSMNQFCDSHAEKSVNLRR